ncbi:MAG: sigma-70 family RNA polymerase sigma factor [Propionibacteriaceae bacterium]|jgi:RNA polymerase sigma-70 factor (ECF subfamily)|nr:sigma-70 family RNA polymerase sigma factor [Propionibacteriaceae bacterium]
MRTATAQALSLKADADATRGLSDQDLDLIDDPATPQVIARYRDMVYRIALTHTRCVGDADDVFQEVFLAYHRRQPEFSTEGRLKAWLITTALNCAKHQASTSWRTRVVPLRPEDAERVAPVVFSFRSEMQDAVFRALGELPEQYRSVLHLFYFDDLSVAQIAQLLGLAEGAVKMRLSRGRDMMRSTMLGGMFDD